ncbi:GntR family transcriptional regulator [Actinopolymorpha singaporensis]|uniref:GntR family transcriptional regulator n=1 Tax=Actinopolymorpha singaporensis TaxID=117157 RepID=A0A1H1TAS2_9ACTN|nr:GntR family transcriptional regulator [Actinopolymorpha singaporensis]SDS57191.1 GntR family transcriptional regulator [Actinopolymorpha singaporensis]
MQGTDTRPLHRRITDDLRRRIGAGEYQPGDMLPSEASLRSDYDVTRGTVRQALQTLVGEGLVSVIQGRGYLVREREALIYDLTGSESPDRRSSATHDIWITDVQAQGRTPGMRLDVLRVVPPADVVDCLELAENEVVVLRRRVRLVDDQPYSISSAYWPLSIAAGTPIELPHDMQPGPLAWLTKHGRRQVRVHGKIAGRMPTSEEAETLRLPAGAPVFEHTRTGYDEADVPLRTTVDVLPTDRFVITYDLDV